MKQRTAFNLIAVVLIASISTGCATADSANDRAMYQRSGQQTGQAKYIFLFVGDGMSIMQRTAAEYYLAGPPEEDAPFHVPQLAMNSLPVVGLTRTITWNAHVTDSAAAATAMATGRKTRYEQLSVDPVNNQPMKSFGEIVRDRGWRVGMVTSSPIDDATAGAFYAHEASRGNKYEVAMSAANSGFYYLAGGGPVGARIPADDPREWPIDRARKNGFQLVHNLNDLMAVKPNSGPVWAFLMGGRTPLGMAFHHDLKPHEPSLTQYTRKGIELLDNEKGFFIMVEGGLTDWAGHGNCLASSVREVLALDEALREALLFYALHPDETLIIVTGDHDTGGLSMGSAISQHNLLRERVDGQKVSMSGVIRAISGWKESETSFEDALPQIMEMFSWEELSEQELADLEAAYAESMKGKPYDERATEMQRKYGRLNPLQAFLLWKVARDSGVTWTTNGHSSLPVVTSAIGVGAERFGGHHDNTDIFRFMMMAAGIEIPEAVEETPRPAIKAPAEVEPVPVTAAP